MHFIEKKKKRNEKKRKENKNEKRGNRKKEHPYPGRLGHHEATRGHGGHTTKQDNRGLPEHLPYLPKMKKNNKSSIKIK